MGERASSLFRFALWESLIFKSHFTTPWQDQGQKKRTTRRKQERTLNPEVQTEHRNSQGGRERVATQGRNLGLAMMVCARPITAGLQREGGEAAGGTNPFPALVRWLRGLVFPAVRQFCRSSVVCTLIGRSAGAADVIDRCRRQP